MHPKLAQTTILGTVSNRKNYPIIHLLYPKKTPQKVQKQINAPKTITNYIFCTKSKQKAQKEKSYKRDILLEPTVLPNSFKNKQGYFLIVPNMVSF